MKSAEELPRQMIDYIEYVNSYLGVGVSYVSNGPGRDQIVRLK
jgi:adenylosuccinate synthase